MRIWKKKSCIICNTKFQTTGPHQNHCSLRCKFESFPINKDHPNGCWIWTGSKLPKGYGRARFRGIHKATHRLSWECFHGPIPNGLCVCHSCHTPSCVNPDHLYLATSRQNQFDSQVVNRLAKKLTAENVVVIKKLIENNISHRKTAKMFHVCHALIGKIKRGQTWTHI